MYTYIIEASDGTLYTGVTTDLVRRFKMHLSGKGAKYLRGARRPVKFYLAYDCVDKRTALRLEYAIKQLDRHTKLQLLMKNDDPLVISSMAFEAKRVPISTINSDIQNL